MKKKQKSHKVVELENTIGMLTKELVDTQAVVTYYTKERLRIAKELQELLIQHCKLSKIK